MATGINLGIGHQQKFSTTSIVSFPKRTIGGSQGGPLVVPKEDHWWFPRKTIGGSQGGPLVVPEKNHWWFPRKTIGGSQGGLLVVPKEDQWWFPTTTFRRSQVSVKPATVPKRPRRNLRAETSTPKPPRRNLHDETSRHLRRNLHAEISTTWNFPAGINSRGHIIKPATR